jgi:Flp pilus assembly protein TadG
LRKKKSKELAAVPFIHIPGNRRGERGSIIVMVAICMAAFMLMLGLCIDVSRIYMMRAELQNAADAAALSAARELNSGTTGIDAAVARANNIVNTQGFGKVGVSIASIQFAVSLNGTYMSAASAKNDPTTVKNIRFVQVTTQSASTPILFAASVLGGSQSQSRQAVAGMSIGLNTVCDYFNIAIAVDPSINPTYTFPTGTELPVHFQDGTGNSGLTLNNMQYTVLDTSWVSGNGANETRDATAGTNPRCIHIGDLVTFSRSNSANNPFALASGTNTRFDCYSNGLTCPNPRPDLNISQSITLTQYLSGSPLTGPTCAPGQKERRLLLIPIIDIIPNPQNPTGLPQGIVKQFRGFFIKRMVNNGKPNPACAATDPAGDLILEYAGDDFVTSRGFYDPNSCSTITNLTVAVLYK